MSTTTPQAQRVPGETGIWVFIVGDMVTFGVFFAAFFVQRSQSPGAFEHARETLTPAFGATNTILLLTSSLFVARAVRAYDAHARERSRRLVTAAGGCGALFATLKITEWALKLHAGHTPGESRFYSYYYLLTGLHFTHLLVGAAVLTHWSRLLREPAGDDDRNERRTVECCASYWHMVDLLWLVLFPVLYLAAT